MMDMAAPSEPNPRFDVARDGWGLVFETAESRPSPRGLDDETPATRHMGVFPTTPAFTPVGVTYRGAVLPGNMPLFPFHVTDDRHKHANSESHNARILIPYPV